MTYAKIVLDQLPKVAKEYSKFLKKGKKGGWYKKAISKPSRTYFLRYGDQVLPMKAALNRAHLLAGSEIHYANSIEVCKRARASGLDTFKSTANEDNHQSQKLESNFYLQRSRPAQSKFREELLRKHQACMVTKCATLEALEAAHIEPFGGEGQDVVENGLLLRSDIHCLFDRNLIAIDPETLRVWCANSICGDYGDLCGTKVKIKISSERTLNALKKRWRER